MALFWVPEDNLLAMLLANIVQSRFWLGNPVGDSFTLTYIFDQQLFLQRHNLQMGMPGTSERSFNYSYLICHLLMPE